VEAFHDGPHEAALKASIDTDIPSDRAMAIPFYDQITLERLMYYLAVMRSDANAQAFYSPQGSCRLRVLFINALSAPAAGSERWTQYASDVEYVSVDADHFSMFTQPAVGIISNLLTESLS
jgi:thioesterase domain-containing protein